MFDRRSHARPLEQEGSARTAQDGGRVSSQQLAVRHVCAQAHQFRQERADEAAVRVRAGQYRHHGVVQRAGHQVDTVDWPQGLLEQSRRVGRARWRPPV